MSETVKLIIEIPKAEYELIVGSEDCGLHTLTRAVAHGIPLDNIKAEIKKKYREAEFMDEFSGGCNHVINEVLEILDNIGKKSEGE